MKRFAADNKFSVLLCWAVLSSVTYIYCCRMTNVAVLFSVVSFIYTTLLIAAFDFFKRKNKVLLTTAGIVGGFAAVVFISGSVMDTNPYIMYKWYMEPQDYSELYMGNILAFLLLIGYIIVACAYYFTKVRYSRVFVFLICMSPFALYAKTFTDIPAIFMILITTAYFILLLENGSVGVGKKAFAFSAAAMLLSVTCLASFLPKLDYAPFRNEFDELITGVSLSVAGTNGYGEFSDTSSNGSSNDEQTIIYYVEGDAPLLIKGRIYNSYSAEKNVWEYYGDQNNGSNSWRRKTDRYYPEYIAYSIGETLPVSEVKTYRILSPTSAVQVIYTPENPVGVSGDGFTAANIYRNELDEYFFSYQDKGKYTGYTVSYTDTVFDADFSLLCEKAVIDGSGYSESYVMDYYLEAREEAKKYDDVLLDKNTLQGCYKSETAYEQIEQLAQELTQGLSTDYEKAVAIQSYFLGSKFTYDLNFRPSDESIENFILNTKRGVCSKYASAMTLMLRHCGITSRYVEGFSITRYDDEKQCNYVTAADSHAYVQVWIEGYGWMDFDPTSQNEAGSADNNMIFLIAGTTALAIGSAAVLFLTLRPMIREFRFKKKLSRTRGRKQAALIYERIVGILLKRTGDDQNIYTPTEINALGIKYAGCDLSEFIGHYVRLLYGKNDDESVELSHFYTEFVLSLKRFDKLSRRKKHKNRRFTAEDIS